jgi:hypothetical protein
MVRIAGGGGGGEVKNKMRVADLPIVVLTVKKTVSVPAIGTLFV